MNIEIQPEHEQFIQTKIATGKYANAQEVLTLCIKTAVIMGERLSI